MDDSNISSSNSNLTSIVLIYVLTFAIGSLIIVCFTIYCCCQIRIRQKLREMRKLRRRQRHLTGSSAEFDILPRFVAEEKLSDQEKKVSASKKTEQCSDTSGAKSKASLTSAVSTVSPATGGRAASRKKKITFEKLNPKSRSMKSRSINISSEALVHANLDARQSPPASSKSPMTSRTISKNTQD